MTQWLGSSDGDILAIVSRNFFRGEEEREMGFRSAMQKLDPARKVDYLSNSDGLDDATQGLVAAALNANPGIRAVYSIGGGNEGAVSAFEQAGRECAVFIGHDLVASNVALLSQGRISALLHHDLREDARRCCRLFMQYHGALPGSGGPGPSKIDIITPYNIPSEKGFI